MTDHNSNTSNPPQSWSLSPYRALVCGASQGIGAACATLLAERGAEVYLLARNSERLKEVYAQLPSSNGIQHRYIPADLKDHTVLKKIVTTLPDIHILVNNSGGPDPGPLLTAESEAFLSAMYNHVLAAQLLAQTFVPAMSAQHYGRIINIISTSVKAPIAGLGVSNTIRGAMASWAKTMAAELGPKGITVNNVLPGFTATERLDQIIQTRSEKQSKPPESVQAEMLEQVPLKRFAEASEIAEAVAFLASPAAAYITGINIPVDGGRTQSL